MTATLRVCAAQFARVFLDQRATNEKACDIMAQAARGGSRLVVFPEAFLPA